MSKVNRLISVVLAVVISLGVASPVMAEIVYDEIVGEERVAVGANLSEEQKQNVYNYFGIDQGSIEEVVVTIEDERSYLEGVIDDAKIGSRSLSSIYIELQEQGNGLDIELYNIDWLTKEIYANALITVGITDAKIIIASPVSVSGTAALTGIYKAYENITGEDVDEDAKLAATEELVVTGDLADDIGNDEATALVNEIKLASDELAKMDDEKAKEEIEKIASKLDVSLTSAQLDSLLSLARTFENIDLSGVQSLLEGISDKLGVSSDGLWTKIVNFFKGIVDWFKNLFTGGDDKEESSEVDSSTVDDESSLVSSEADGGSSSSDTDVDSSDDGGTGTDDNGTGSDTDDAPTDDAPSDESSEDVVDPE